MTSATIIGGGVIGLAVAKEITEKFDEVYILEKEEKFGEHASGRSSEVNHAGIYYPLGSLKAKFCVEGNRLLREFCKKYGITHLDVGKLVVAVNEQEETELERLLIKSEQNGVPNPRIISGKEVRKIEPHVSCYAALEIPSSAVFDSASYLQTLAAIAQKKGAYLVNGTEVTNIETEKNKFKIHTKTEGVEQEPILTDFIINTAGVFSGKIAKMINPDNNYEIIPVKGESAIFSPSNPTLKVGRNIYPCPQEYVMKNGEITYTTGVHLTPTFDGQATVGPLYTNPRHREDYEISSSVKDFLERVSPFFKSLEAEHLRLHQAGISAKLAGHKDFMIKRNGNCVHLLGIDSPGLTSSLAIGKYVKEMIK